MYAERPQGFRLRPASLGAALAINGGVIAALLLANPDLVPRLLPHPPITVIEVQPDSTPPPPDPQPRRRQPNPQPTAALPQEHADPIPAPPTPFDPAVPADDGNGVGADTADGTGSGDPIIVPPAFVAASVDPRYQSELQPPYPDTLRDAGAEGVVRLRVLIAPDGRVTQVEPLSGAPALLKLASRHALGHWRFRPATRGGVPEESWKVMVVRFRLDAGS